MIKYRKFIVSDLLPAACLVRDVSKRYFHKDIKTAEARKFWKNLQSVSKANISSQKKLYNSLPIKIVATHGAKLVGLVAGKPDEVIMCFVRPPYQGQGIATELYARFKAQAIRRNSRLLKVKSSRFAERFYQKVGFVRTGPEKDISGLPVVPMEVKIRE